MTAPVEDDRLKPLPMVAAWFAARHAQDQEDVANELILALFPLWQIMRFGELDASTTLWVPAALPRVETAYLQSQRLAGVFAANVRAAELATEPPLLIDVPDVQLAPSVPAASFRMPPLEETAPPKPVADLIEQVADTPVPASSPAERLRAFLDANPSVPKWVAERALKYDPAFGGGRQQRVELQQFPRQDVATSLTVEANYNTKKAMPGPEEELMRDALNRSSGAAVRQAMNGGRGVTDAVVKEDSKVIGFARVTDGDPCPFCALLASRGAVFGKGSFVSSDGKFKANGEAARDVPDGWTNVAKVHNNCKCHLRPVFSSESIWDAAARHYLSLWNNRKVRSSDTMDVLSKHPNWKGYQLQRAVDLRAFKRALKENPFKGNQFDMNAMRRDLRSRMDGLVDNGFSPNSPQYQWAEGTSALIA